MNANRDYDSWEQPGWSFKELLPYFKRFENYHCETSEPDLHGYDGPIHISYGGYHDEKFHDSLAEAGKVSGYEIGSDCNNFKTSSGFMVPLSRKRSPYPVRLTLDW